MAAQKGAEKAHAVEEAAAEPKHEEDVLDQRVKSPLSESLERVRSLDLDELRERLGGKMSEEQLEKLSARLATMSPEDLAKFAAGLPSVKAEAEAAEAEAQAKAEKEKKKQEERARESVIVD
ncbi:unnamed protein product [Effrenium voratum]|nr:unnamed protein product [Effrenium voratum]